MRRIKVLHLITHLGFGGASDNTLITVGELAREDYEVHLGVGLDYLDWVDKGRQCADAFFEFPQLYRAPHPRADLHVLQQLTQFMKEQRYDIVHTHNAKAGILGRIAARRAGVPIVLHTYHLLSWQDGEISASSPWWQRVIGGVRSQFYFRLEQYVATLTDAIVTVCEANKREAIDLKLAPPEKFVNIYSGIAIDRYSVQIDRSAKCASLGLDPNRPIAGMIGRLSAQKAPLDFIAAARLVLQQHGEVQFIMVGDGPLLAEVSAAIADEPRIRLFGYRDDVPEILAILDLFVLSSHWEGLGRALTEAMIVGIPVAVTAVNGIPELVTHGETGLLSPPGATASLAENVLFLLNHPDEARRMSRAGQAHVAPNFGAQQMVEKIAGLYDRLLTQKPVPNSMALTSAEVQSC